MSSNKKYKIGYTQGTYDLFHVGHLNVINHAKELCDFLIVGVNSDTLVNEYKHHFPIICDLNRAQIVSNLKAVDECHIVETLDKVEIWKLYKFNAIFIGDDWKGNARWEQTERDLKQFNAEVIYLSHTPDISSTRIRNILNNKNK